MTTTLSATFADPVTLAPGVPCAARPGTAFRHLDGRCQCFFGGAPPQLTPSPFADPATPGLTGT
jgi:hypothetical protein